MDSRANPDPALPIGKVIQKVVDMVASMIIMDADYLVGRSSSGSSGPCVRRHPFVRRTERLMCEAECSRRRTSFGSRIVSSYMESVTDRKEV